MRPASSYEVRVGKDRAFRGLLLFLSLLLIVPLVFILWYIISNGLKVINIDFFLNLPKPVGETGGGISNAIVGSLMVVAIASALSIPIGVATGVCLTEYRNNKLSDLIRVCVEVLMSIPSIVMGIIAYVWIVLPMGTFSALSGGISLGFIMIPVVIRATEETLVLIPDTLKEASLSLGVPYYRTVLKVIIPTGFNGIMTGTLLGVARVAGETAPLLFTAFGNPFMNVNMMKAVNTLPLLIFNYATSPYQDWQDIAWGASLVLVAFVFCLSIFTKVVVKR